MQSEEQEIDDNKIAPIFTEEKRAYFIRTLIQTLLGVSLTQPYTSITILLYIVPSVLIPIIAALISHSVIGPLFTTLGPRLVIIIIRLISRCMSGCQVAPSEQGQDTETNKTNWFFEISRALVMAGYNYMLYWHFRDVLGRPYLFGLSVVTVFTSLYTLHSYAVKQFGMQTAEFSHPALHSTFGVRVFLGIAILVPEIVISKQVGSNETVVLTLQHMYAFLWLLWTLGLVSSIKATCQLALDAVNQVVFGHHSLCGFSRKLIMFLLNAIVVFAVSTRSVTQNNSAYYITTNCILIGLSFLSCSRLLHNGWLLAEDPDISKHPKTNWVQIACELCLVVLKILLTVFVRTSETSLIVILAIDIAVFAVVSLILDQSRARTHFGQRGYETLSAAKPYLRLLVRVTLDIAIVFAAQQAFISGYFNTNDYWRSFALRVLVFRSYKRAILRPLDLSQHLAFVIALACSGSLSPFWICLLAVQLPQFSLACFVAPFIIPKKNQRSKQSLMKPGYLATTCLSLLVLLGSLGIAQPLMFLGLPLFVWSLPYYEVQQSSGHGKEKSIYKPLTATLSRVVSEQEVGIYLVRISKYLVVCQVVERGIGYRVVQIRGLEAQQVTSCHGLQSKTVDQMIEITWGDKAEATDWNWLRTSLRPQSKDNVQLFEQNEITLAGILQSPSFAESLRSNFIKVLIFTLDRDNPSWSKKDLSQFKKIKNNLFLLLKEADANSMYPHEFAATFGPRFKKTETQKSIVEPQPIKHVEKLPPVKQPQKQPPPQTQQPASKQFFDDLDFMMAPEQKKPKPQPIKIGEIREQATSDIQLLPTASKPKKSGALDKLLDSDHESSENELTKSIPQQVDSYYQFIISMAVYALGKSSFLQQKKLYEVMQSAASASKVLKSLEIESKGSLAMYALRAAFKLTVDETINAEETTAQSIQNFFKSDYLGVLGDPQFQKAVQRKSGGDIWVLKLKDSKISISRYAEREVELYLFGLDSYVVKSIWNNLRFEMLYATNDDDERYSIQTHPNLLRNILVEAAAEPFGYAPFYSGPLVL